MENLFSTTIAGLNYRVIFKDDCYTFLSEADNKALPTFSFKRENDEWHDQQPLPPDIKTQAVDALERYLLQQH